MPYMHIIGILAYWHVVQIDFLSPPLVGFCNLSQDELFQHTVGICAHHSVKTSSGGAVLTLVMGQNHQPKWMVSYYPLVN